MATFRDVTDIETAKKIINTAYTPETGFGPIGWEFDDLDLSKYKSVLDYGCGIGRLTKELASKVPTVHAVDFPNMIALAKEYLPKTTVKKVKWHELPCDLPTVELCYACLVLQMMNETEIADLCKRLKAAGVQWLYVTGRTWMNDRNLSVFDVVASHLEPVGDVPKMVHTNDDAHCLFRVT